jgi:phage virion morphogenesis protein
MAGTYINFDIDIDDRQVKATLDRLIRAGVSLVTPMRNIAEELLNSTQDRFDLQQSPDGVPWAPLSEKYLKSKRKRESDGADAILVLEKHLRGELAYNSGDDWMEITAPRVYAATHQFGDDSRNIEARPFLGISDDDMSTIHGILAAYLGEVASP